MRPRHLLSLSLALALGGALLPATPGQAQGGGRSWQAYAGGESDDAAVQVNTYRPSRMAVGVGDSVTWVLDSLEPHTVTFLSGGARPPTTLRIGDVQFRNPLATMPAGGSTYMGTGYVNSGFLDKGDTFTLTFAEPGSYEYVCLIHSSQRGQIEVQAGAPPAGQSQASLDAEAQAALARELERGQSARSDTASSSPRGSVAAGGGTADVSVRAFGPAETTVRAGETVTWTNSVTTPHTVTFTSGEPAPEYWQRQPQAGGMVLLVANPEATTRQGGDTYDGNGFFNSGVMTSQANNTYALRFARPGTYEYVCLLYLDFGMRGTVTVTP